MRCPPSTWRSGICAVTSLGEPLWRLLGGHDPRVPAYGSGTNLGFPLEALVGRNRGFLARGLRAGQMKVGRPGLQEDLERVAAVRAAVGPDIALLVAEAHHRAVTIHGLEDVQVHLLAAVPNASYLAVGLLNGALEPYKRHHLAVEAGRVAALDRPGHGLEFDPETLAPCRVAL